MGKKLNKYDMPLMGLSKEGAKQLDKQHAPTKAQAKKKDKSKK